MKKLIFLGLLILSQFSFATAQIDRNPWYNPQPLYSYGHQAPRLGDMDQTLLYGAGGALLGNGLTYLFGGNRLTGSILGGLIGLYAGYQEDKSENIERSLYTRTSREEAYVFDDCWGTNTKARSAGRRSRSNYNHYQNSSNAGLI